MTRACFIAAEGFAAQGNRMPTMSQIPKVMLLKCRRARTPHLSEVFESQAAGTEIPTVHGRTEVMAVVSWWSSPGAFLFS